MTFKLIDNIAANDLFETRETIIKDIIQTMKMNKSAITISNVVIYSESTIKYSTIWSTGITHNTIAVQDLLSLVEKYLEVKKQNYITTMHQFMIDNVAAYGKNYNK